MPEKVRRQRKPRASGDVTPVLSVEMGEIAVEGSEKEGIAFAIRAGLQSTGMKAGASGRPELVHSLEAGLGTYRTELRRKGDADRDRELLKILITCVAGEFTIFYLLINSQKTNAQDLANAAVEFFRGLPDTVGRFAPSGGGARFAVVSTTERSRFVHDFEHLYTYRVEPSKERLPAPTADAYDEHIMTRLSFDEQVKLLEKLAKRLRDHPASPDLAEAGISEGRFGGKTSRSISIIDRERDDRVAAVTKAEVFGDKAPSVPGFRQYLRRLIKMTDLSYDQKREICKTVNFWKNRLGVQLLYEGQACSLKARPSGGKGGAYHLRSLDAQRTALKDSASFPPLDIRRT